eukprot:TRINITY_DN1511_c0_g1_i1.p1 TRINITY_DN1511_c0_g1~~TRINITY_DN1511_c0_g1_i1.p1  ORF type:complete len:466 (-),score=157.01 TRINITY_DN1511_c0_g1_i1:1058-2407(-)
MGDEEQQNQPSSPEVGGAAAVPPERVLSELLSYGDAPEDKPFQEWYEKITKKTGGAEEEKAGDAPAESAEKTKIKKKKKEQDPYFRSWYSRLGAVEVAYLPSKGRSLVASKDLDTGDTLLKCFPYTWAADEKFKTIICRYCLIEKIVDEENPFATSCSQCNQAWYCSESCMVSDAPLHKGYECLMLASWELDPQVYETDVITEMKLLLRTVSIKHFEKRLEEAKAKQARERAAAKAKKLQEEQPKRELAADEEEVEVEVEVTDSDEDEPKEEEEESITSEPEINFPEYDILISRPYDFPADTIEGLKFWICDYLSRLGIWLGLEETPDSLLEMLIRNRLNSFSIWNDPSMRQRGIGVYVSPSFMNHDCNPNVNLKRYSTSLLEFCAARPIKKGEEITISYVDTSEELDVRRQKLRSTYLFLCRCQRCIDEETARVTVTKEAEVPTISSP